MCVSIICVYLNYHTFCVILPSINFNNNYFSFVEIVCYELSSYVNLDIIIRQTLLEYNE